MKEKIKKIYQDYDNGDFNQYDAFCMISNILLKKYPELQPQINKIYKNYDNGKDGEPLMSIMYLIEINYPEIYEYATDYDIDF